MYVLNLLKIEVFLNSLYFTNILKFGKFYMIIIFKIFIHDYGSQSRFIK